MTPATSAVNAAANLSAILARMETARKASLQPARKTSLVAVTKGHAAEDIVPVLETGHRLFGENRVQEAAAKWPGLRARFAGVELHLIGPLQTNKVREAVALFDAIQTLDRAKLAEALAKEIAASGRAPVLFVQVNTGEEPQKAGVSPRDTGAFVTQCRAQFGLAIAGLMCIPPLGEPPAPHFALLRKLAQEAGAADLSMGMSADFETAIRFGATHVRVGTAIFGAREK